MLCCWQDHRYVYRNCNKQTASKVGAVLFESAREISTNSKVLLLGAYQDFTRVYKDNGRTVPSIESSARISGCKNARNPSAVVGWYPVYFEFLKNEALKRK